MCGSTSRFVLGPSGYFIVAIVYCQNIWYCSQECTLQVIDCTVLLVGTVLYCTVLYSTVHYCTVQYSTVQYSTVQYGTVQYSTIQYCEFVVLFSPLHKTVNVTYPARCVTQRLQSRRRFLYVMILRARPHFLQLRVSMQPVTFQIKCGQFWQCSIYIYIYSPQIVVEQVFKFQCTGV